MKFFFPAFALLFSFPAFADDAPVSTVTNVESLEATPKPSANPEAQKIVSQIKANISQGRGEFKSCSRFKKKFKKIVPGGLNFGSPSHLNKKQALEYLAVLEKYPEPARGFSRALELFSKNIDVLVNEPDQPELVADIGRIEDECAMFSVMVHVSLLFKDVSTFEFNKKERAKVERIAKAYLAKGLPLRNFTEFGVKANVLKVYVATLFDGPEKSAAIAKATDLLKAFESARDADVLQAQQVRNLGKADTLEAYRFRWAKLEELSSSYSALVKDVGL